jgi:short subunit dehydrogenase-like uncharacterized protein
MDDPRIALYGATGYTGRLVAAELARRGLDAVLAGRNARKLAALRADLQVDWPVREAAIDDAVALRAALGGCRVVINCAGPFTFYGAPVIDAALGVGAHHVDTTGEQLYMQRVFEHLDAPARERGLALLPAIGFDYVPGDLLAAAVAEGLGPLRELRLAYALRGMAMTRGTMRSGIEMVAGGDVVFEDGDWRPARRVAEREQFTFPAPVGAQPVVRYPGGEQLTVPRHVTTRRVVERITTASVAPGVPPVAVPLAAAGLGAITRLPAIGGTLDALIGRLPEGPGEGARRAAGFTIVAEAVAEDGREARGVVRGHDVYGITAVIAVEVARRLGDAAFTGSGALAPAQAVDPRDFLAFLGGHGVSAELPAPASAPAP